MIFPTIRMYRRVTYRLRMKWSGSWATRTSVTSPTPMERIRRSIRRWPKCPSDLFGICVVGTNGAVHCRRRGRARIFDHERVEAVRLRIGLSGARRGAGAREAWCERHRTCVQFGRWHRTQPRRTYKSDGQCRRDRHDQPGAGRDASMPNGSSSTTACPSSPGARLPMNEEVLQSALGDQLPQQEHRQFLLSVERIYCDPMEAVGSCIRDNAR